MRLVALGRDFFERHSAFVAPEMVGKVLVVRGSALLLTEVEAYGGAEDPASHASRGRTPRCADMFGDAGSLYVYFTYGMHHCLNVVAHPSGDAGAVLVRAGVLLLPGGDLFALEKGIVGPARICKHLGLSRSNSGKPPSLAGGEVLDLAPTGGLNPDLYGVFEIEEAQGLKASPRLGFGPRVGVSTAREIPWRFWNADSKTVSRYRPGRPRLSGELIS